MVRFSEWQEREVKIKCQRVTARFRMVVEVSDRTTDAKGNALLLPLVGVDGRITSLDLPEDQVIGLYGRRQGILCVSDN